MSNNKKRLLQVESSHINYTQEPEMQEPLISDVTEIAPSTSKASEQGILTAIANEMKEKKGEMFLKAVIYGEILSKPVSQRTRRWHSLHERTYSR